jgi:uncharacterized protein (TIGR03083 family)
MDLFELTAAERRALADDVDGLSTEEWHTPSAIKGWEVSHIVAHLVWPLETPKTRLVLQLARHGFSVLKTVNHMAATEKRHRGDLARQLRAHSQSRFRPPGHGPETPLTEIVVHSLDVRWPLKRPHQFPAETARRALDFLMSPKAAPAFRRRGIPDGLHFQSAELQWSRGNGPTVTGPVNALLLSLCGRKVALGELQGEGAETFRARFSRRT